MGLFGNQGASKNDVKLAKLELEKQKLAEKSRKNKSNTEALDSLVNYSRNNMNQIQMRTGALLNEYLSIRSSYDYFDSEENASKANMSKAEIKKQKQRASSRKEKCEKQLQYIYLAKDFFEFLGNYALGISLTGTQCGLITKFAPYFVNGAPVLDERYQEEQDDDDSILGAFKEIGMIYKEAFVGSSKDAKRFDFESYLYEHYSDELEDLVVPNINSALENFAKAIDSSAVGKTAAPISSVPNMITSTAASSIPKEIASSSVPVIAPIPVSNDFASDIQKSAGQIECPTCQQKLNAGSKFCAFCGTKIEVPKPSFCTECGTPLTEGAMFCSGCGNRIL